MLIAGGSALLLASAAGVQMEIPSLVIAVVGPLGVVPMPEGEPGHPSQGRARPTAIRGSGAFGGRFDLLPHLPSARARIRGARATRPCLSLANRTAQFADARQRRLQPAAGVRRRTDHAGARRQRNQLIRAHPRLWRCADRSLHPDDWLEAIRAADGRGRNEDLSPPHRVAGDGHPPPAPTERSVPISGTTLFEAW